MKKSIIDIPFSKIHDDQIEFQIKDIQTLFDPEHYHDIEYPHRLNFNVIMIVIEGEGKHFIDFETYEYKKGSIFFIAKGQIHAFSVNKQVKCFLLQFTDTFLNRLVKDYLNDIFDFMRYPPHISLKQSSFLPLLENFNLLNNEYQKDVDTLKEPILQSLLQAFLLTLKRERTNQVSAVTNKDKKLYHDFLNIVRKKHKYSLHVNDYLKELGVSIKTLSNVLNKYTGRSTKIYLNEYLLLEIKRYLLDEGLTLQEIANKLDFDEPTNLVKFFKRFEKMTPSEFKNAVSVNNNQFSYTL